MTMSIPLPHNPPALQVIELNVSTVSVDPNKTVDITHGGSASVRFSYSVKWAPTATLFEDRMDRYSRYSFLPQHLEVGGGAVGADEGW